MKQGQNSYFFKNKKSNQNGQAAVEYVLLLVVIVSLIIGMTKVFSTLEKGVNKYIGDYITCLMEYGELPTLGVQDSSLKKHIGGSGRVCDEQYDAFSFADGRPASGSSGSSSSGSSGRSSSSSSSSTSKNSKSSSSSSSSSNSSASNSSGNDSDGENETASGITKGGRDGRGGSSRSANRNKPGQSSSPVYGSSDRSFGDNGKVKIIDPEGEGEDEDGAGKKGRKGRRNIRYVNYGRDKYRAVSGRMLKEIEKREKNRGAIKRSPAGTVRITKIEDDRLAPTKKTFTPPVAKKDIYKESKETPFGFGNLIRWLFIAGMIVAIVIFFGGQLLNYSNSDSN